MPSGSPSVVESGDEIGTLAQSFNLMASPTSSGGGNEAGVFRDRLTRAPVAAHVDPRSSRSSFTPAIRPPHAEAGSPHRLHRPERLSACSGSRIRSSKCRAFAPGVWSSTGSRSISPRLVDRVVEELHPQAEEAGIVLKHERARV